VQLTARLTHPHTVTIFDYGRTADGVFYYAMELLDGAALDRVVTEAGPLPPERVAHVLYHVAGALAEAHAIGLIHRDIKPANIILCRQGGMDDFPKVVDFGLVKDLEAGADTALTHADVITGTPLYLSPEAITAPGSVSAASDLYSLGAVGYFALTGEHVFSGGSLVEVCSHHLHTAPVAPSARLQRAVPEDLESLILACLEKDPAGRPDNAAALRRRLEACECFGRWTGDDARLWWAEHGEAASTRSEGREATPVTLSRRVDSPAGHERDAVR
jgi:serine/threonine-protein kinase